jgi:hypothetical protein
LTNFGNIIGNIDNSTTFYLTFSNVFFSNDTNALISNAIGVGNSSDGSSQGFSYPQLIVNVNNIFDQCLIWDGLHLRTEYNYSAGPPVGCPSTTPPSKIKNHKNNLIFNNFIY